MLLAFNLQSTQNNVKKQACCSIQHHLISLQYSTSTVLSFCLSVVVLCLPLRLVLIFLRLLTWRPLLRPIKREHFPFSLSQRFQESPSSVPEIHPFFFLSLSQSLYVYHNVNHPHIRSIEEKQEEEPFTSHFYFC